MGRAVNCECGEQVAAAHDEELVENVRQHIMSRHPERRDDVRDDDVRKLVEARAFDS